MKSGFALSLSVIISDIDEIRDCAYNRANKGIGPKNRDQRKPRSKETDYGEYEVS